MANAFHKTSFKQRVRRAMLVDLGRLPIPAKQSKRERFLLIRPDHLGDVLLTTPAILALRAAKPNAEIHVLAGGWSADALANYDEIDLVLTLPFPGFSRTPKNNWRAPYQLATETAYLLRQIAYSDAIIFRPDHWWGAMVTKFARIPRRVGFDHPDVSPFLTNTIAREQTHAVTQNLRLIEPWTGAQNPTSATYRFPVDAPARAYMNSYLEEWGVSAKRAVIVIHPGAGTEVKRWGAEQWADVADTLSEQLDAAVVFTGGDHEMQLVRDIVAHMRASACLMVGATRVNQLAALYERAKVVLGPDSGPLHLAVAVGTPTVALFGPADPVEFGPWGSPQRHQVVTSSIACRPCRILDWSGDDLANHPCVRDITVGQVLTAARTAAQTGRG